jgi:transcription initiation factor TFIIIB Brf1 subunit/transcription initiation factor TFIIB
MTEIDSDDDGFGFYGKIDTLVDGLDLPQSCFEASCRVCDMITEMENYKYSFTSFGGFDAVVATSVFVGARQERCPVPAQVIADFVETSPEFELSDNFSGKKLNQLGRKFRRELEMLDPVFVDASDYVSFYGDRLSFPVKQEGLEDELDVSQVAVRYTYKEIVEELTGLDTSHKELEDVEVTPASFGYHGSDVTEFGLHLLNKAQDENLDVLRKSPQVLAASVLYVSGMLI